MKTTRKYLLTGVIAMLVIAFAGATLPSYGVDGRTIFGSDRQNTDQTISQSSYDWLGTPANRTRVALAGLLVGDVVEVSEEGRVNNTTAANVRMDVATVVNGDEMNMISGLDYSGLGSGGWSIASGQESKIAGSIFYTVKEDDFETDGKVHFQAVAKVAGGTPRVLNFSTWPLNLSVELKSA